METGNTKVYQKYKSNAQCHLNHAVFQINNPTAKTELDPQLI